MYWLVANLFNIYGDEIISIVLAVVYYDKILSHKNVCDSILLQKISLNIFTVRISNSGLNRGCVYDKDSDYVACKFKKI